MELGREELTVLGALHSRDELIGEPGFRGGLASDGGRTATGCQDLIYNVAFRILADAALAHEITQQVLGMTDHTPVHWRRRCRDLWRMHVLVRACRASEPVQATLSIRRGSSSPSPRARSLTLGGEPMPQGSAGSPAEASNLIQAGLGRLPFDLRVAVVLSDVGGFGCREIAQATGVSVRTARSRLGEGRAGLRDSLFAHAR